VPVRILLDQNAPLGLCGALSAHEVIPARDAGWAKLTNGDLIRAAEEAGFSILITCDRNIRYQQNLAGRDIALIELTIGSWPIVRNHLGRIRDAINAAQPGTYSVVSIPRPLLKRRPYSPSSEC
jgi:hypothetical protein